MQKVSVLVASFSSPLAGSVGQFRSSGVDVVHVWAVVAGECCCICFGKASHQRLLGVGFPIQLALQPVVVKHDTLIHGCTLESFGD